jgi:Domain of unknown function (DUF4129)
MASYLDCKIPMRKKIFFIVAIVLCIFNAKAQYDAPETSDEKVQEIIDKVNQDFEDDDHTEVVTDKNGFADDILSDTTAVFRTFELNEDSLKNYKKGKKYEWIENLDSLLRDAKDKEANKKPEKRRDFSFFDKLFNSGFLKIMLFILAGCFVLYVLYNLFLSKGFFTKGTKKATIQEEEEAPLDHLNNNFDNLYDIAYTQGNFRLAMRFLFLKTLQKLNDKNLIEFAADKTNSSYARELPVTLKKNFAQLALYYEYIWYGNTPIQKESFDEIKNKFTQFLNKV